MTEKIKIIGENKKDKYVELLPQIEALIENEIDVVANMANIAAALKQTFDFFWVGFYTIKEETLVLAPFQGPVACTRIKYGKGVCGTSWKENKTIVVPDVELFPGHIACNSESKSEIALPVSIHKKLVAILDIDSNQLNTFDEIDTYYLEL